ncbi:hypothetical protein F5884DRAFT_750829 [Xylogone sp. PMI_703]|nr:hypothetical protein F5884DRAFT_750829 [Xylogone sp. PMI_703]
MLLWLVTDAKRKRFGAMAVVPVLNVHPTVASPVRTSRTGQEPQGPNRLTVTCAIHTIGLCLSAYCPILSSSIQKLIQNQSQKLDLVLQRIDSLDTFAANNFKGFVPANVLTRQGVVAPTSYINSPTSKNYLPLFQGPSCPASGIFMVERNLGRLEHQTGDTTNTPNLDSDIGSSFIYGESVGSPTETNETEFLSTHRIALDSVVLSGFRKFGIPEVARLLSLYDDMVGTVFPVLTLEEQLQKAREIYELIDATFTPDPMDSTGPEPRSISKEDVDILKIQLCIALLGEVEVEGQHEASLELYNSLQPESTNGIRSSHYNLKGLIFDFLICVYYYFRHEWRPAWRTTCNLCQKILELGMNKPKVLNKYFPGHDDHALAITLVWSIFVLDQQLSYALGLPAITQNRFDLEFPLETRAFYLRAMIEYARLGSKACDCLYGEESTEPGVVNEWMESLQFYQFRLRQWQQNVATELELLHGGDEHNRGICLIRALIHLRSNQLHILTTRPLLRCSADTMLYRHIWTSTVEAACSMVHILCDLNNKYNIYYLQQAQLNYFLVSALGVLFLDLTLTQSQSNDSHSPDLLEQPMNHSPTIPGKVQQSVLVALYLLCKHTASYQTTKNMWNHVASLSRRLIKVGALPQALLSSGWTSDPVSDFWNFTSDLSDLEYRPQAENQPYDHNSFDATSWLNIPLFEEEFPNLFGPLE